MGAYLIGPVCMVYARAYDPAAVVAPCAAAFAALTILFCVAGPAVPDTDARPEVTAAENWPVISESVKREE